MPKKESKIKKDKFHKKDFEEKIAYMFQCLKSLPYTLRYRFNKETHSYFIKIFEKETLIDCFVRILLPEEGKKVKMIFRFRKDLDITDFESAIEQYEEEYKNDEIIFLEEE